MIKAATPSQSLTQSLIRGGQVRSDRQVWHRPWLGVQVVENSSHRTSFCYILKSSPTHPYRQTHKWDCPKSLGVKEIFVDKYILHCTGSGSWVGRLLASFREWDEDVPLRQATLVRKQLAANDASLNQARPRT